MALARIVVLAVVCCVGAMSDMNMDMNDLSQWVGSVGSVGEAVATEIRSTYPEMKVQVVPHEAMVTMDYNPSRVRVFVDNEGKVVRKPQCG